MGGALATICAIDLKFAFGLPDVRVYTYGSPRVGNDIFASFFAANIQVRQSIPLFLRNTPSALQRLPSGRKRHVILVFVHP